MITVQTITESMQATAKRLTWAAALLVLEQHGRSLDLLAPWERREWFDLFGATDPATAAASHCDQAALYRWLDYD